MMCATMSSCDLLAMSRDELNATQEVSAWFLLSYAALYVSYTVGLRILYGNIKI